MGSRRIERTVTVVDGFDEAARLDRRRLSRLPDSYQRAEGMRLDGVDDVLVTVISLADLRRNERAAGRAKDLADLEELPEG